MTEIVPGLLWTGSAIDIRPFSKVLDTGVEAVVDLALEEQPPSITREAIYCRYPLVDGGGNSPGLLRAAVETVVSLMEKQIPTLVYCSAGMSRSPAIVAAALAALRGVSLDAALEETVTGRAHDVSPVFWEDAKRACGA
jgi:protein-tyrosine phosphatase